MAILVPRHFEPGAGDLFEDRSTLRLERIFIYKDGVWLMNGGMAAI